MISKVSVIIPAHNEEKMIGRSLKEILRLEYPSIEIIICLDGCTDNTERITNDLISKYNIKNKKIIIIKNKKRLGKAATIMKLIKKSTGKIIILNDADWRFVSNKKKFDKLIKCFEDPKIGGIHLGTTFGFLKDLKQSSNINSILYLGNAWACILVTKYQIERFTKRINDELYADKNKMLYPFMIDIFRKKLINNIQTPCDDAEFTYQILQKGYELRIITNKNYPRFEDMNRTLTIQDTIKTKIRGEAGRKKLKKDKEIKTNLNKFYLTIFPYILLNINKVKTLKAKIGVLAWLCLTIISLILSNLSSLEDYSSRKLWEMKVERK